MISLSQELWCSTKGEETHRSDKEEGVWDSVLSLFIFTAKKEQRAIEIFEANTLKYEYHKLLYRL